MGKLSDQLDILQQEQRKQVIDARAQLRIAYWTVSEANANIQNIIESEYFDTIPNEIKKALQGLWILFKQLEANIKNNADYMEILSWREFTLEKLPEYAKMR